MPKNKLLSLMVAFAFIALACQFTDLMPVSEEDNQATLIAEEGNIKAAAEQTVSARDTESARVQATVNAQETEVAKLQAPTETAEPQVEPTKPPPPTDAPTQPPTTNFGFPDTFDDNRNGWDLDDGEISGGKFKVRGSPKDTLFVTACEACGLTLENNLVRVDATSTTGENSGLGLILDGNTCTDSILALVIWPPGYYRVLQSVREGDSFSHWRPFIDFTETNKIKKGASTNQLSAVYEFADDLAITIYINDAYMTRFSVYGYNGTKECLTGLNASGGHDVDFDNFSIEKE